MDFDHSIESVRLVFHSCLSLYPQSNAKHLVIGNPKSFFSLYSVIRDAGLCPCHLDSSGELLAALPHSRNKVQQAVSAACQHADCILVAVDLIWALWSEKKHDNFLMANTFFQHAVVYSTEPESQRQALEALSESDCIVTHIQIADLSKSVQEQRQQPRPVSETSSRSPKAEVNHDGANPTPGKPSEEQDASAALAKMDTPRAVPDWPLVVSNNPQRPIMMRRGVYENILGLERQGATIVERGMIEPALDLILSPSTALVINVCEAHQVRTVRQ